jgi:hypothetical protein
MSQPIEDNQELEDNEDLEQDEESTEEPQAGSEDIEKLKSALEKERQKSARLKAKLGGYVKNHGSLPKAEDEDAVKQQISVVLQQANSRLALAEVKAALAARGVKNPARIARLATLDDLSVTDDGDIEGLDDVVDALEEDYPEFFEQHSEPSQRKPAGSVDAGRRSPPPKKSDDAFDAFAQARFGRK